VVEQQLLVLGTLQEGLDEGLVAELMRLLLAYSQHIQKVFALVFEHVLPVSLCFQRDALVDLVHFLLVLEVFLDSVAVHFIVLPIHLDREVAFGDVRLHLADVLLRVEHGFGCREFLVAQVDVIRQLSLQRYLDPLVLVVCSQHHPILRFTKHDLERGFLAFHAD